MPVVSAASRRPGKPAPSPARWLTPLLVLTPTSAASGQGPYDPASGPGSRGVPAASASFTGFANLTRGPAVGNTLVSLGDGGSMTLTFAAPVTNGPGADFAVFENEFLSGGGIYAELGHVEVSSNGVDFVRFASVSPTPTTTQVGGFGPIDPTNVNNLVGKHVAGTGTPFDLAELAGNPLVDVTAVTHVRVVDVVGSVDPQFGTRDSLGNLINDPFATPFASGGFDLDAVGVIHSAPVPEPAGLLAAGAFAGGWLGRRRPRSAVRPSRTPAR